MNREAALTKMTKGQPVRELANSPDAAALCRLPCKGGVRRVSAGQPVATGLCRYRAGTGSTATRSRRRDCRQQCGDGLCRVSGGGGKTPCRLAHSDRIGRRGGTSRQYRGADRYAGRVCAGTDGCFVRSLYDRSRWPDDGQAGDGLVVAGHEGDEWRAGV